jgi:hypothetical protein
LMPQILQHTQLCGQANLAWLLCWSPTKTPPSYM